MTRGLLRSNMARYVLVASLLRGRDAAPQAYAKGKRAFGGNRMFRLPQARASSSALLAAGLNMVAVSKCPFTKPAATDADMRVSAYDNPFLSANSPKGRTAATPNNGRRLDRRGGHLGGKISSPVPRGIQSSAESSSSLQEFSSAAFFFSLL